MNISLNKNNLLPKKNKKKYFFLKFKSVLEYKITFVIKLLKNVYDENYYIISLERGLGGPTYFYPII